MTLDDGREVFAKTLRGADSDLFRVEADGLRALHDLGGARTPRVVLVTSNLLVLEALRPRDHGARFWERAGRMLATVHHTTGNDRFGWEQDAAAG